MKKMYVMASVFFMTAIVVPAPQHRVVDPIEKVNFGSAFVLPTFVGDLKCGRKKYVLLGHEVWGRDKDTYCAFGGSRDWGEHMVQTAAREFKEESLIEWDINRIEDYIVPAAEHTDYILVNQNVGRRKKTSVLFITQFDHATAVDLMKSFKKRRASYGWWNPLNIKYREMDQVVAVEWDELKKAIAHQEKGQKVMVSALNWNTAAHKYQAITVQLRPIQVKLLRNFVHDEVRRKKTYKPGLEKGVRYYN